MTSKEYLKQGMNVEREINSKLRLVAVQRALLTRVNETFSDMPGNPNRDRSKLEECMVKIIDLENEVDADVDRLVELRSDIMKRISMIDDPECRILLTERYLNFRTWDEIADELTCTVRNVHHIHSRALCLFRVP